MSLDISHTLEPNSDQIDAVDFLGGSRIFTIERVTVTVAEQPVNIFFADFPRPWRPGKSMRRVLASCWGPDGAQYVGRRIELYCDPAVVFGGQSVGGTRISRLSHIDGPKKVPLLVSRGKSAIFVVKPLPDEPTPAEDPMKTLVALLSKTGRKGKEAALSYCSGVVGHEITSSNDLTPDELAKVITALEEETA